MPNAYEFKLEGASALVARLEAEGLIGKPIRRIFSKLGIQGKQAAKSMAPKATGRLSASITTRMSGRAVPKFVAVLVKATNSRGYSYPKLLEFSFRHGHRNWLLTAFQGAMGGLHSFMNDAAKVIEDDWKKAA